MTTWLALIALGSTPVPSADWAASCGLRVAELASAEGSIHVYLPARIAPGDTISGTVFAFGSGPSVSARNLNQEVLQSLELTISGKTIRVSEANVRFQVPSGASAIEISVRRPDGGGPVRSVVEVRSARSAYAGLAASTIVEEGYAIRAIGRFDGDRDTTEVKLDGIDAGILAESPRECVISTMNRGLGAHRLQVSEGAGALDQKVNIARLTVTPPEEARIGRKSFIELEVDGLKGADPRGFPLLAVLRSPTPEQLSFGAETSLEIRPDQIVDGLWKGRIEFKAKKKGRYELLPQLIAQGPASTQ
jgi:hypothetical protein